MRRTSVALLVLVLVAGGCGDTTTTSTSPATQPTASSSTTTSRPPLTTSSSSSTTSTTTTTTTTIAPALQLGPIAQDARLPSALATADVPWESIGPGWVIASIAARHEDPGALTAWGLYFIAPDDTHYEIGTAPGYGWNFRLQAWSPSGQRLLATVWNEETEQEQVWLVDLVSGSMEVAAEADHGGWIGATFVTDDRISVTRGIEGSTTLELIDLSTGNALARAEQYFDPDSQDPWLYMYPATSQQIGDHWVTVAHSGIQVHDIAGNLEGTLPLPGLACLATRAWDTSTILVECADPAGESDPDFEVWGYTASRGLWLVPLDGSPTTRLAGPGWFSNAFTIGDTTLLETSGCCECGGGVQFEGAESWWNPPEYEPCRPEILGLRNGHFLIQDLLTQERHVSILFEIDEAGAMLAPITDATGPYGGLMMALLWEG